MAWVESLSASFRARHESRDADDVGRLLDSLERTRDRLALHFPRTVGDVAVVVHGGELALALARPHLPLARWASAPAARRYVVGWVGPSELHVLAPRILDGRASSTEGSREMLALAPAALYARLVIAANNPALPPPFTPGRTVRWLRWAWLAEGTAQWFSGQAAHARPAIARRLREGSPPSYPPGLRDASLLGGTLIDLLARERDAAAAARLATRLHPQGPEAALAEAFGGPTSREIEAAWRARLAAMPGSRASPRSASGEG